MMLLIRTFERRIEELFEKGHLHGTAHLCIGQEAAAVGAVAAARATDPIVSSHRGHGHFLARSDRPAALMGEMLGRTTGPCMGRGGSQHLCAPEFSFYGTNGITGGGIPTATGLALRRQQQRSEDVVLCFFGDGATNQGTFHESLNMASLWDLPVVYICENNLYAMSTPVEDHMAAGRVADRARGYDMPARTVDGMDVNAVREAVEQAGRTARQGGGPTLIEARCYRFCGHSKSDRLLYRDEQEEECWQSVDPIRVERCRLANNERSEEELEQIESQVRQRIEEAYRSAMQAPKPSRNQVLVSPYRRPEEEV